MPRKWSPLNVGDGIDSHIRQPSAVDCQRMIRETQSFLNWSDQRLANFLGVCSQTLQSWKYGRNNPVDAARRLIWWFWCSICHPEHLEHPFAFPLWIGVQESEGMAKARAVAAACAKGKYPPYEDRRRKSKRLISNPGAISTPEK